MDTVTLYATFVGIKNGVLYPMMWNPNIVEARIQNDDIIKSIAEAVPALGIGWESLDVQPMNDTLTSFDFGIELPPDKIIHATSNGTYLVLIVRMKIPIEEIANAMNVSLSVAKARHGGIPDMMRLIGLVFGE